MKRTQTMGERRLRSGFLISALAQVAVCGWAHAQSSQPTPDATPVTARVATMQVSELKGFDVYPDEVKRLIGTCLELTELNLTYTYGSADPAKGGMDCSGTIYYVLKKSGLEEVPRSASGQYVWTRKARTFSAVISRKMDSFELEELQPGDLLFWTGTYATSVDPPVTHSMIYLGKRKKDGKPVMFGASNGRSYDGMSMWGVSVFDFRIPKAKSNKAEGSESVSTSIFIGYAKIPGLKSVDPR